VIPPKRHWRCYGAEPLPTAAEALNEPFSAFRWWYLRVECDRCGMARMVAEIDAIRNDLLIREILARMRHDGCGGLPAKAELLTGIEGAGRPVRRIVLRSGQ
jgi:hypothetical protein